MKYDKNMSHILTLKAVFETIWHSITKLFNIKKYRIKKLSMERYIDIFYAVAKLGQVFKINIDKEIVWE